jgi:tRNA (mo5U34)-methyltransferase
MGTHYDLIVRTVPQQVDEGNQWRCFLMAAATDLRRRKLDVIAQVPFWWHTIDLGDGVITPGHKSPKSQDILARAIPRRLRGKTVLDVGCWDGFFSFWCERRGATVTPVDNFQYRAFVESKYGVDLKGGEGFRVAAHLLGSPLKLRRCDFASLRGSFDIVLFLGVLYHERYPLLALEHLARLARECAMVETHYIKSGSQPLLRFYPGDTMNEDPANFWGPTLSCVELMLEDVSFQEVSLLQTYWDNDNRAIFLARK